MTEYIGIIGVGHLAAYMVKGFYRALNDTKVLLSPRGKVNVTSLQQRFGCKIAQNNQDVVNQCDIIIISVKPQDVPSVLKELVFRPEQLVISVAAGVPFKVISQHVTPATAVCALPISSVAINQSPTIQYPAENRAYQLLLLLGPVTILPDENQFITASTYSAFYGWTFHFLKEIIEWGVREGLPSDVSRNIVQQIFKSTAGMTALDPKRPLGEIVTSLATPGGITEQGIKILEEDNGFIIWKNALDRVHERLMGDLNSSEDNASN
ncbi:pyrroline-5-carboxylate reductase family protein [Paremcibacter congregatus]|uniref:pyrroline-5-carboxylate reductase family protein n=1 Tax=Paremcibacter congregatus TaxID=2043170 RepID=UPI003A8F3A8C